MSFNKILTTAVMTVSVAAGSLLPVASAANAADGNHRRGHGVERGFKGGHEGHRPYRTGERWNRHAYRGDYGYRQHRDNTGRNLAIGAFATILGLAIAAETSRVHDRYYDERD